jgi:hypothetical protein
MSSLDYDETYPYGRRGVAYCHYKDSVSRTTLVESADIVDNAVTFYDNGRVAVLYEAPTEKDPVRGHFSVWTPRGSTDNYQKVESMTGDDGMIYEKYNDTTLASLGL